jgi:Spy/CpxP family protein refolding chaperone
MNRKTTIFRMAVLPAALAATLFAATPARAETDDRPGYAWGMMGPGMMMGGYGRGYGMMGPGMMDMMMGGGMMGPGMMGGGMMGPGMMMGGGYGMGMLGMLDLSDDQRATIRKIEDEQRKKNRDLYAKIEDESVKLRDLYDTDAPDANKIGAAYDKIFALQRQAIVAGIEAQNKARAVLTKEQQEQLKQWRRGGMGMGPGRGYGPGDMPRGMGPGMMGPGRMGR